MSKKVLGYSLHSLFVLFPMGLLIASFIFDLLSLLTQEPQWNTFSMWAMGSGIVWAFLSALLGLVEWLAIPANSQARSVGLWHGIGSIIVVLFFVSSFVLRRESPGTLDAMPFILSCIGVSLALTTAWLGGELVERLPKKSLELRPAPAVEKPRIRRKADQFR